MTEHKTIGKFEIEASEETGRIIIRYKNSEISVKAIKDYFDEHMAIDEFEVINSVKDIKTFFRNAHTWYAEIL